MSSYVMTNTCTYLLSQVYILLFQLQIPTYSDTYMQIVTCRYWIPTCQYPIPTGTEVSSRYLSSICHGVGIILHILQNKSVGNGRYLIQKYCQIPTARFADEGLSVGVRTDINTQDLQESAVGAVSAVSAYHCETVLDSTGPPATTAGHQSHCSRCKPQAHGASLRQREVVAAGARDRSHLLAQLAG
jgi:hypothetical protein